MDIEPNIKARIAIDSTTSIDDIHRALAQALEFPVFYEKKLTMLDSCLRNIDKHAFITFELADDLGDVSGPAFRLITVVVRAAFTNPQLTVTVEHRR